MPKQLLGQPNASPSEVVRCYVRTGRSRPWFTSGLPGWQGNTCRTGTEAIQRTLEVWPPWASERVDALVVDDAHACIDAIKGAYVITLERKHPAYQELLALFGQDLEDQGVGTFAELRSRDAAAFLPVPYWAWMDRHRDVAAILAKHTATKEVFVWPLIRDHLRDCLCVFSGKELVIAPYRPPHAHRCSSTGEARRRVRRRTQSRAPV